MGSAGTCAAATFATWTHALVHTHVRTRPTPRQVPPHPTTPQPLFAFSCRRAVACSRGLAADSLPTAFASARPVDRYPTQGVKILDLPPSQQASLHVFVTAGVSCDLNIKTAKGFVMCKLANITNA